MPALSVQHPSPPQPVGAVVVAQVLLSCRRHVLPPPQDILEQITVWLNHRGATGQDENIQVGCPPELHLAASRASLTQLCRASSIVFWQFIAFGAELESWCRRGAAAGVAGGGQQLPV
jgi:hypothetical protein